MHHRSGSDRQPLRRPSGRGRRRLDPHAQARAGGRARARGAAYQRAQRAPGDGSRLCRSRYAPSRSTSESSRRRQVGSRRRPHRCEAASRTRTIMTVLNGLGAEEAVRDAGSWPIISGVTFMSGTRHSDTHVEYVLDTETWLGPYERDPLRSRERGGRSHDPGGAARRGAPRPAPGPVVEADLQRHRERGRGPDRSPPRLGTSRPRSGRAISAISSTTSSPRARPSPRRPGSSCTTTRGR